MTLTQSFFEWFYIGLGGLGGWFLFFLLALAAVVVLLYDSAQRRIRAIGWKTGTILTAFLILPAIIARFSSADIQLSLGGFTEWIFYLGLLGGIIPPVLVVGYFVTYRGMIGCPQGHVYEAQFGECPECARLRPQPMSPQPVPPVQPQPAPHTPAAPMPTPAPKVAAWLVAAGGTSYQLNQGQTIVGRGSTADIRLTGDKTVSREHAKIVEANGRFRIIDLGGPNGTYINGRRIQSEIIEPNDVLQFGDNIQLRFKA